MQAAAGLPTTAGQHPHDPGLMAGASGRTSLSAARLRGLLAACKSLGAPREAGEQPRPEGDAFANDAAPLDALAACERCRARGEHAVLLALLEADALRELVGHPSSAGAGSDPDPAPDPGRPRKGLGAGYREALEHDAALPAGARARVAALNALRGVLLGERPRAALLLGAGLQDLRLGCSTAEPGLLSPGLSHVKAEATGHGVDHLGVAEYLLRVLRRLGAPDTQAGAGAAPAPALQEQAGDLAAWLEAASGLGAGASPTPEQPQDAELPDCREPAMQPALGGERSRLGAFLAHLRAADAGLQPGCNPAGLVQRGQHAEAAAAGDGAGAPAGEFAVKAEPSSAADELGAPGEATYKAEPVAMDSQRDAADASGAAVAAEWAAAALRARAVHLACLAPDPNLGREEARDSVAELFASAPGAGGCGLSDLAFGAWLCRGGGSDALSADGGTGSRKRKRDAGADQGAPTAPPAAAAEGPAAMGDARQAAADDRGAGGRSLPCDLAGAVERHGLPSPALLAQALAQLLDERAWDRVRSLERAAAARADPIPDPHLGPDLQGDAACRQLLRCGAALAAFLSGLLDAPSSAAEVWLPYVPFSCCLPLSVGASCLPLDTYLRSQDKSTDLHTYVPGAPPVSFFKYGRRALTSSICGPGAGARGAVSSGPASHAGAA